MIALCRVLVVGTFLLGALGSPAHKPEDDHSLINWDSFQSLLDSVDPAALHSVLHSLSPKFQDGVFSKDRAAIEHVHSENPIIASKLVHLAKKRQESNSTTTSSIPESISSELSSEIFASTVPAATTITVPPEAPASATPVETADGAVVFSTLDGGLVTLTSSAARVSFTPSTSTHLYTTTAADGQVRTATSVVIVNAPLTDSPDATGAAGAAATTGDEPELQDAATAVQLGRAVVAFAGLGWLLFFIL